MRGGGVFNLLGEEFGFAGTGLGLFGALFGEMQQLVGVERHPDQARRFDDEDDGVEQNAPDAGAAIEDERIERHAQAQMMNGDDGGAEENGACIVQQRANRQRGEEHHVEIDLVGRAACGDQQGHDFAHHHRHRHIAECGGLAADEIGRGQSDNAEACQERRRAIAALNQPFGDHRGDGQREGEGRDRDGGALANGVECHMEASGLWGAQRPSALTKKRAPKTRARVWKSVWSA